MMMKVLIADSIASPAVAELRNHFEVVENHFSPDELLSEISNYDAIIIRSATKVTRRIIEAGSKLKVIGRAGVGVDNIDLKTATEKGIYVVNSPLASTISVAEMAIAYILALSRRVIQANIRTKKGEWPKKEFMGNVAITLINKQLQLQNLPKVLQNSKRREWNRKTGVRCGN